jgi:hypothetical protein
VKDRKISRPQSGEDPLSTAIRWTSDWNCPISHLRKAEADLVAARERIKRQEELMSPLQEHGHDTSTAQSVLQTMRDTLTLMEEHRALILDGLAAKSARS